MRDLECRLPQMVDGMKAIATVWLDRATILMQGVKGAPKPHTAIVDRGYRGVEVPGVEIIHRGQIKSLSAKARRLLKRRQAVLRG